MKKQLDLQHKNAATAAEKEHAEHLLKKIEAKQEKESENIRKKEAEAKAAKEHEVSATQKAVELNKTAEVEKKANLVAHKEFDQAKATAEKAAKDQAEKQEALKKLAEKNEQEGEDAYKKLIDSVPKGSSLAEQSEQTPDHVYELAASIIDSNPSQEELLGRHEVIRIDKNVSADSLANNTVKSKVHAAIKNVAKSADSADDFDNI